MKTKRMGPTIALLLMTSACAGSDDTTSETEANVYGRAPVAQAPTCGGEQCFYGPSGGFDPSTTVAQAVRAKSVNGYPALRAKSTAARAGNFFSHTKEGVTAETYATDALRPAVRAKATSATALATVFAKADGANGVGVELIGGGGDLLEARNDSDLVFRIAADGRMYSNGVWIGRKGQQGPPGQDGADGEDGDDGAPGDSGTSNFSYYAGSGTNCFGKCSGSIVASFDSPCNIGALDAYSGSDGVCCICAQ